MQNKRQIIELIDKLCVFILSLTVFLLPLVFSTITTDPFSIPKEMVLFLGISASLILLGARFVIEGSVRIRRTPFDLPIVIFTLVLLFSSVLAVNQSDSLQAFVPFLFIPLMFFSITNLIKKPQSLNNFVIAFGAGGLILSLISIFSYLKIYVLPFPFARVQTFSTFGSLFDQAIYLAVVFITVFYFAYPAIKERAASIAQIVFGGICAVVVLGVAVSLLGVIKLQPAQVLPYETGFQIGLASISQDSGRVFKSMALGSGFGTFYSDFTRFKPASFNTNTELWSISFFRSSSFVFELLATAGILGLVSFLFICLRIVRVRPIFVPAIAAFGLAFVLPLSFLSVLALFAVLGVLSAEGGFKSKDKSEFYDIELHLVAFKKGIIAISEVESKEPAPKVSKALTGFGLALIIALVGLSGFYMGTFALSDVIFQKSFNDIASNNAQSAYNNQSRAISIFPGRDGYHRLFSQLNLTIANNLASSIPKGQKPNAQQQQTIYQLIQQSINSARQATSISPQNVADWQNLSAIYRSLIGFGQNADTFAILSAQQAAALDPNNPIEYITVGGIFYQLKQWDSAITQFQIAANLKPDYANAYYNLGHAYEEKGDLKTALTEYQTVRSLVGKDPTNLAKINAEIDALQKKINQQSFETTQTPPTTKLNVNNEPPLQLPAQPSPIKIPGPNPPAGGPTPSPSPSPSPTNSPAPSPKVNP